MKLEITGLTCGYGDIVAVRDFAATVNAGETLALLGANGAGKTSTLMSIAGLVGLKAGRITVDGQEIGRLPAHQRIRAGIALVPEGRRVFADLSVIENLTVGGQIIGKSALKAAIERVVGYFPRLGERAEQRAGSLSGGEQQMLAMGRALISSPRLLLVDELSLGLMPKVVDECYRVLRALRDEGIAVLLVEQNTERALAAADKIAVLEAGNQTWSGSAEEARANPHRIEAFLGDK